MAGPEHRRLRGTLVSGAVLGLIAAGVVLKLGFAIGSASLLLWATGACLVAAAAGCLYAALRPAEELTRWSTRAAVWQADLQSSCEPPELRRAGGWLVALGLLAATCNLWHTLHTPDDPADDDQAAYLQTAVEISRQGPWRFWVSLWSGEFAEANRHPLYLAALAIQPTEWFGRCLACGCGVAAALLAVSAAVRRGGWLTAGLFTSLLAVNSSWLFHSARVFSESLLLLASFSAWLILSVLLEPAHACPDRVMRQPLRPFLWLTAGALLGLAWLTKGTGLVLLLGAVFAVAWDGRKQAGHGWNSRTIQQGLLLLAGFAVVASPLLARNLHRFGSPFYNVNSQLLFVDVYSEPEVLATRHTTSAAAAEYWQTHSLFEIARRGVEGAVWETFILLRSLGPAPLDDGRVLFGITLGLLSLVGLATAPGLAPTLTVTWTVLLWLMFAWYVPIAAGERFVIPVLLPLLLCAASGAARMLSRLPFDPRWVAAGTLCAGCVWLVAWTVAIAMQRSGGLPV